MGLPSTTPTDFPQGLDIVTITIDGTPVEFVCDAIDIATTTTRNINRTDENGDYAETQTRASSDPVEGTMTLQKASNTTPFPEAGLEFSLDYDSSGTASTLRVTNVKASRSKSEATVFEIGVLVVTYQG